MKHFALAMLAGLSLTTAANALADDEGASLTVYNQGFAVVRQYVPLTLQSGVDHFTYNDITFHVEPDSVILRDPAGTRKLQVLEQNYRADPISQDLLLSLNEGKTIEFQLPQQDGSVKTITGKIIRSGYAPHTAAYNQYGNQYAYQQMAYSSPTSSGQPIIEVDGKLQFGLPGTPIFPALPDDAILKPTLDWTVATDKSGPLKAELAYITDGMTWHADYNAVMPEEGDKIDLVGWVTLDNETGKDFKDARIKLMAGDVSKLQQNEENRRVYSIGGRINGLSNGAPPVSEKAFDDYHLYTLQNKTSLRDRETKQVEFVRAADVNSKQLYIYDGVSIDSQYSNWDYGNIRNNNDYGTQCNPKVWTMREIVNSKENGLGMALPKGRIRFYRRDSDGQLEFIGENEIDHTPKDETLRVYTGSAFDITGERKQTSYKTDWNARTADESFEIKVRNHKKTPVTVRIVEHLYRGDNWTVTTKSTDYTPKDAHTLEFPVTLDPDKEQVVDYTVHYTW